MVKPEGKRYLERPRHRWEQGRIYGGGRTGPNPLPKAKLINNKIKIKKTVFGVFLSAC